MMLDVTDFTFALDLSHPSEKTALLKDGSARTTETSTDLINPSKRHEQQEGGSSMIFRIITILFVLVLSGGAFVLGVAMQDYLHIGGKNGSFSSHNSNSNNNNNNNNAGSVLKHYVEGHCLNDFLDRLDNINKIDVSDVSEHEFTPHLKPIRQISEFMQHTESLVTDNTVFEGTSKEDLFKNKVAMMSSSEFKKLELLMKDVDYGNHKTTFGFTVLKKTEEEVGDKGDMTVQFNDNCDEITAITVVDAV